MRVMVLVKANEQTEKGEPPKQEMLEAMMAFNEELLKAGVILDGDGLTPSSQGARVYFSGDERKVVDGPFSETKELIAGYWVWQVKSFDEAIEWAKRIPNPTGEESIVELRPFFEAEDFGDEFTPELRAKAEAMRAQEEQLREQA